MATHLLNILPSSIINNEIPFTKLFNKRPTYNHLPTFGYLCYPYIHTRHKLQDRSTPCVFLGYPTNHCGYRCLNLNTNNIIISCHVNFDKDIFPFQNTTPNQPLPYHFLDNDTRPSSTQLKLLTSSTHIVTNRITTDPPSPRPTNNDTPA